MFQVEARLRALCCRVQPPNFQLQKSTQRPRTKSRNGESSGKPTPVLSLLSLDSECQIPATANRSPTSFPVEISRSLGSSRVSALHALLPFFRRSTSMRKLAATGACSLGPWLRVGLDAPSAVCRSVKCQTSLVYKAGACSWARLPSRKSPDIRGLELDACGRPIAGGAGFYITRSYQLSELLAPIPACNRGHIACTSSCPTLNRQDGPDSGLDSSTPTLLVRDHASISSRAI